MLWIYKLTIGNAIFDSYKLQVFNALLKLFNSKISDVMFMLILYVKSQQDWQ